MHTDLLGDPIERVTYGIGYAGTPEEIIAAARDEKAA